MKSIGMNPHLSVQIRFSIASQAARSQIHQLHSGNGPKERRGVAQTHIKYISILNIYPYKIYIYIKYS